MEFHNFWYLLLLIGIALIPVIYNIKYPINFIAPLKYFLPAFLFTGTIFVIWNIRFTEIQIWSFSPYYTTGIELLNLPIEEWLSLLVFSSFSMYFYEQVKSRFCNFEKPNYFLAFSLILVVFIGLLAWYSRQKLYPFFTFFLLFIYLGYTIFRNRFKKHLTKFYLTYLVTLIPFFLLKGILCNLPALMYENMHTLGIRVWNVPVEDFGYLFLLLIMNISIFEYLKERRFY